MLSLKRILISELFKKGGIIAAAFHSNPYLSGLDEEGEIPFSDPGDYPRKEMGGAKILYRIQSNHNGDCSIRREVRKCSTGIRSLRQCR